MPFFFFSSRRRHTRSKRDWSSDVCSSDLDATDARFMLQPAPLPHQLRQDQFGGTLSGPLKKDKTFFFMNYEGKRRAESPVYPPDLITNLDLINHKIGRASCRERV